jgi:Leucine-rich repeat (LRR) protein
MSDEPATPRKVPAWALMAGVTVLAIGTRALIAFAEREVVYKELTATKIAVVALAAASGTFLGRRWINRLSGLLLGVVFAGIAALLLAGRSNIVPGLGIGLLASGVALGLRGSRRSATAVGVAMAVGAGAFFAAEAENPLIWGCLAGVVTYLIYGYRIPRREHAGLKSWLAFGGRTAALMVVVAIAAWWGSLAPIRAMIAQIRAPGFAIEFLALPSGPLRSLRKELETAGLVPVQSIAMSLPESDNSFIAVLAKLPALEYLELADATLDEQALADLAQAPALMTLHFSRCQVAEGAWSHLARIRTLQQIQLRETEIGSDGIAGLAQIPSLTTLSLEDSGASVEALTAFSAHTGITTLHCSGPTVHAGFLRVLDHLPRVTSLSLVNWPNESSPSPPAPATQPLGEVANVPELVAVRGAASLWSLNLSVPLDENLRRGIMRETPNLSYLDITRLASLPSSSPDFDHPVELADLSYSGVLGDVRVLLQPYQELRWVDASGCGLEPNVLATIATLSKLETLVLDRSAFPPAAIQELTGAQRLSSLSMRKYHVPDGSNWAQVFEQAKFSQLPALRELDLAYNGIVDAELASLGALPNLRSLNLKGNRLTNAALAHLSGMTSLEQLDLRETQVTAAGVQSLRERLPKLEIRWSE